MSKKKTKELFPKYHINPTQEAECKILNDVYEKRPTRSIEKEYSLILVEMLSSKDTSQLADSVYKLRQLDFKLKEIGYRATINVGSKKID